MLKIGDKILCVDNIFSVVLKSKQIYTIDNIVYHNLFTVVEISNKAYIFSCYRFILATKLSRLFYE